MTRDYLIRNYTPLELKFLLHNALTRMMILTGILSKLEKHSGIYLIAKKLLN
jgi:hypothetical protein